MLPVTPQHLNGTCRDDGLLAVLEPQHDAVLQDSIQRPCRHPCSTCQAHRQVRLMRSYFDMLNHLFWNFFEGSGSQLLDAHNFKRRNAFLCRLLAQDILSQPAVPGRQGVHPVSTETFQQLMQLKYMRSLAAPGEAVGVIAAQSVGKHSFERIDYS